MTWLNVDIRTKNCTIHSNHDCGYVKRYCKETDLKGVNELKNDGGWLLFKNHEEGKNLYKKKNRQYNLVDHC